MCMLCVYLYLHENSFVFVNKYSHVCAPGHVYLYYRKKQPWELTKSNKRIFEEIETP